MSGNQIQVLFVLLIFKLSSGESPNSPHRIVGGVPAKRGQFPYQVMIGNYWAADDEHVSDLDWFPFCGGSIIAPRYVLSAGHCMYEKGRLVDITEVRILAGQLGRSIVKGSTVMEISKFKLHPKFTLEPLVHDLVIFTLKRKLSWTPLIRPVPLRNRAVPVNTACTVSGWGVTKQIFSEDDLSDSTSKILLYTTVYTINFRDCYTYYDVNKNHKGILCAQNKNKIADACVGDSGGPLVCDNKRISGIVSIGIGCADPDYPAAYTDVVHYVKWIRKYTKMRTRSSSRKFTNSTKCRRSVNEENQSLPHGGLKFNLNKP